ncbi:MAG: dTDP-4-dehydrorhamnose reductase [Gallionellaceae bacterium]|jgi:dTDP-4-dehydrorhamnose reductase|nr:dTDP-4-dehydrorhamnose reductase [Gallionellaceae bacterium]
MSRILLTGSNGQLGWELRRSLAGHHDIIATDRNSLDLADADALRRAVRDIRPDLLINAAAYTDVEKAESEPAQAHAINNAAPGILAEEAHRLGAAMVHYSTGYVFDGDQSAPYAEGDTPNPQSVYGASKLAGELAVRAVGGQHLILRTNWVYGAHGDNFVKTVLRLAQERDELRIVADQFGAPTWARDLAQATSAILDVWQRKNFDATLSGVYHLTAAGRVNWYDYAKEIMRLARDAGITPAHPDIRAISASEYPGAAKRPANSLLANDKARQVFDVALPEWQASLAECMNELR